MKEKKPKITKESKQMVKDKRVNYEDIKNKIKNKINEIKNEGYNNQITLYASNYSDIQ